MTYEFSLNSSDYTIVSNSYLNAISKACDKIEHLNDEVDLLGLDNWDDVIDECANHELYVSDIVLIDEA